MVPRKSLLRQQIHRALSPTQTPWLLALGILASQPITPLYAADNHYEWSCKTAANGQNWDCSERAAAGAPYKRPKHSVRRATTGAILASGEKPRNLPAAQVDWVDEKQLTDEQKANLASGCCGTYLEPERSDDEAELNPEDAPMRVSAESSEWIQETTAVLQGDIQLTHGYRQLESDKATLDQDANTALVEGNIRLRVPGVLMTGASANMSMDSGEAQIQQASYLVHEARARGDADSIDIDSDKVLTLNNGTFTRCEPDSNLWYLKGSELKIDPHTNQGSGKHVRLNVKGIPVFYTPYIRFPAGSQRQSGFLFPSVSSSDGGGLDVAVPYYFNLAPNYDMTLTPRVLGDRGEMLEAEVRHLSESFETTISAAFLASDKGGEDTDKEDLIDQGLLTEDQAYPHKDKDRWLLGIDQLGGLDSRWYSRIDYTHVSDIDYFRDLDNASLQVNSSTHLRKSGALGYRSNHWLYEIKAEEFQVIATNTAEQYKQLPRIRIEGDYRLGDNWLLDLDHEFVRFDHRDQEDAAILTGDRARLDYGLSWDKQWIWGFFKPSVMVKSLHYKLDDDYLVADANDAPSFTAPQASLDTGLYFEREGSLIGNRYLQTFEPRLFYFYSERENQDELIGVTTTGADVDFDTSDLTFTYNQLFRDTRFTGGDRIDDDNRLSIGLTSRIIDPSSGIERFSASLGQILYFEDRAVSLNQTEDDALRNELNQRDDSEFAAQFGAQLGDHWRLRSDIIWDESESSKVHRGSASLRYKDDELRLFNLSYRYNRKAPLTSDPNDLDNDGDLTNEIAQTIEQGDISFSWPLFGNWSTVGRANYDFTHKRELESLFGVEYNDCCYRLRLVARKWLDNDLIDSVSSLELEEDQGIFFEFQLKGLGSIGSKVTGVLNEGIYGYEEREKTFK